MDTSEEYRVETECINQLAVGGLGLHVPTYIDTKLKRLGRTLLDAYDILRGGRVVRSDMVEDWGDWIVQGTLPCGAILTVRVAVRSQEQQVELLDVS